MKQKECQLDISQGSSYLQREFRPTSGGFCQILASLRQINDTTLRTGWGIPKKTIAKGPTQVTQLMRSTTLIFLSFVLSSCVSVKLGNSDETKRATGVEYREPKSPFAREDQSGVDASWKNQRNGNSIAFLSDCKDPSDPPLDNIVQGVIVGLSDLNVESKETVTVQSREGRRVLASGKVDGVPSLIDLLVFKRNTCIYILTYVGVKSAFNENRGEFNKFLESFRAP
jgi:hypothetical protein